MVKLEVVWCNGMNTLLWARTFAVGTQHDVTRETKTAYFLKPAGFPREIRVSKAHLRLTGFKDNYGAIFSIA